MTNQLPWEVKAAPAKKAEDIEVENMVADLYRRILFHNKVALVGINQPDINFLATDLVNNHTLEVIRQAHHTIIRNHLDKSLTFGVFLEKCQEITRANENDEKTKRITRGGTKGRRIAKGRFAELKELLRDAVKPLPYNKDIRVHAKYSEIKTDPEARAEAVQRLGNKDQLAIDDLVSYGADAMQAKEFVSIKGATQAVRSMIAYTQMVSSQKEKGLDTIPYSFSEFLRVEK